MDSDQNIVLQTLQMDGMWKAMTIFVTTNVFQSSNGIFSTNAAPVNYTIPFKFKLSCTRLEFNVNLQQLYQPVLTFSVVLVDYQYFVCLKHIWNLSLGEVKKLEVIKVFILKNTIIIINL